MAKPVIKLVFKNRQIISIQITNDVIEDSVKPEIQIWDYDDYVNYPFNMVDSDGKEFRKETFEPTIITHTDLNCRLKQ